jgi:hypothetical protein
LKQAQQRKSGQRNSRAADASKRAMEKLCHENSGNSMKILRVRLISPDFD